jgi:hypothetical protein
MLFSLLDSTIEQENDHHMAALMLFSLLPDSTIEQKNDHHMAATTASVTRSVLSSPQLKWAVGGWIFFIAENAVLSENRTWIIEEVLGGSDEAYHAAYGTCSTAATASIVYGYYQLRKGAAATVKATNLPVGRWGFSWVALSAGCILASQTVPSLQVPVHLTSTATGAADPMERPIGPLPQDEGRSAWKLQVRCPFDFTVSRRSDEQDGPIGVERVTRHPGLWAFGCIGLGAAAAQPTALQSLFWTGPAFTAWLGGGHTDSRYRRGLGGTLDPVYDSQTSNVPLAAILTGRQGNVAAAVRKLLEESKPLNAVAAFCMATAWVLRRRPPTAGKMRKSIN